MSRHPYFTSGLEWALSLAEAKSLAQNDHRKIFIAHGHRFCSGTRALIERTLQKEEVAEMMAKNFVAVASDNDAPDPDITSLLPQLPKREPTPLCIYLDAGGKLLASTAGGRPPAVLLNDMLGAMSRR
jgi:hypothetical protein